MARFIWYFPAWCCGWYILHFLFFAFWQLIFLPNCQTASKSSSTPDHFRLLACAPKAAWLWNLHPPKFPSSVSFLRKSIGWLLVSSMSHAFFRMGCVPVFILEGLTALIIMEICFSKFARSSKCLVTWMCTKRCLSPSIQSVMSTHSVVYSGR